MIVVGVDRSKQRNMCHLNAINREKNEEDGGVIKLKDGMHEYDVCTKKGTIWKVIK